MTSPSPDPLARVYVAAPMGEAHVADLLRALLDRAGFRVVSRWTDRLRKQSARPSRKELTAIHRANSAELDDADLVVAWTAAGTPRATYGEIGAALAKGKPVLWLQGPRGEGSNSYDTEPLVRVLYVDPGAMSAARELAIVAVVQEMAEEQRERAARLVALAHDPTLWDEHVAQLHADAVCNVGLLGVGDPAKTNRRLAADKACEAIDALARAATSGAKGAA
jgi:hypothetical protein